MTQIIMLKDETGAIRILHFSVFIKPFDLTQAILETCKDYAQTADGFSMALGNFGRISWEDFWNDIPNALCRKHGFFKQKMEMLDQPYDWEAPICHMPLPERTV